LVKKGATSMYSIVICSVAVLVLLAAASPGMTPPDAPPSVFKRDNTAGPALRSDTQTRLARGIEAAWEKAHGRSAEDVTTAFDGNDIVTRIRTPLGTNLCLNWRDIDRFSSAKGKAVFVTACNR
jgi:hypothetical protein